MSGPVKSARLMLKNLKLFLLNSNFVLFRNDCFVNKVQLKYLIGTVLAKQSSFKTKNVMCSTCNFEYFVYLYSLHTLSGFECHKNVLFITKIQQELRAKY